MTKMRLLMLAAAAMFAGCGEPAMLACDEGPYMTAVRMPKVKAPDGLDELNPLNEVPLPDAAPPAPRPDDSRCLDFPPRIIRID